MASKKEAGRDSLPKYGEFISEEKDSFITNGSLEKLLD